MLPMRLSPAMFGRIRIETSSCYDSKFFSRSYVVSLFSSRNSYARAVTFLKMAGEPGCSSIFEAQPCQNRGDGGNEVVKGYHPYGMDLHREHHQRH
jgi:hypothetical protein